MLLAALALWLRLAALPGVWGTDSLSYFESVRAGGLSDGDPRRNRVVWLALVRVFLHVGGGAPSWASVPGALASAAVVPVLWLALRRRVGDALALLPCLLWTFLGSDLEEVVEISPDAFLALPAALAAWGLVVAARRDERATLPLVAAGAALGAGAALKETMLYAVIGFGVGALCVGRGGRRWRNAAVLVAAAGAVLAVSLLVTPERLAVASRNIAHAPAPVRTASHDFLRRVTVEIPELLLTATRAYGLLFVVTLPLLARLPFRAARGDALAAATLAGFLAFDLLPASLETWSLLPATFPRYFLCLMPPLLASLACAVGEPTTSRGERWTSLAAAALGLAFARGSAWAMVVVPVGLTLTAWPAVRAHRGGAASHAHLAVAAAVLLVATVAWGGLPSSPSTADWTVAAVAGTLVVGPWVVGRATENPAPRLAVGAALILAVATARSRFVPDLEWTAWRQLPPTGRVFAEEIVGRRLRAAAQSAGADADRVILLDELAAPPQGLAPDDRVIARELERLDGPLRLAASCRIPESGLRRVDVPLGEAVLFEPVPSSK